jgi:hypothetical protein
MAAREFFSLFATAAFFSLLSLSPSSSKPAQWLLHAMALAGTQERVFYFAFSFCE